MNTISDLLKGCDYESGKTLDGISVKGVTCDSRKVREGDLFVCIKGGGEDGHLHALEAQMLGAVGIVAERETESGLPTAIVTNSRKAYSKICQNYFKNPKNSLKIVTIVGTNGKTTTSCVAEHILKSAGYRTGLIGTLGCTVNGKKYDVDLTTPDSFTLNRLLRKMVQEGVEIVILEVSAHAIAQDRLYGLVSDICIFTNLSHDHLDYFGDYQTYSDTKLSYFCKDCTRSAIVNTDDKLGQTIFKTAKIPLLSYGLDEPADIFAIDVKEGSSGTTFIINLFDELYEMTSPLLGLHNLYNVLGAVTLAKLLKVQTSVIAESLQKMPPISGRFNVFQAKSGKIVVDFAHTPDGLANLLRTARTITEKNLTVVFGCGGERDKSKRPEMGKIAERLADRIILTEDNSRGEETAQIIGDILSGIENKKNITVAENRKAAIKLGWDSLSMGDVLVIAGKGGENYIEKNGRRIKYSDESEIAALIRGGK